MAIDPAARRRARLFELMDALERELGELGWWEPVPPPAALLDSVQPFSFDTLTFTQWLQWQFIPRMRSVLRAQAPLPTDSAIYPYAESCLEGAAEDTRELMRLIERVDAAIRGESL